MRWVVEKGREKHLCLSTLMVTNGDANLFLGVEPVTPLRNSPLDEVKREVGYAVRLGIRIRYVLLDRGYEDRKIRRYLAAQMRAGRIDGFVQPAVKNTTVKRHIIRCAPGAAGARSWSPSTATTSWWRGWRASARATLRS